MTTLNLNPSDYSISALENLLDISSNLTSTEITQHIDNLIDNNQGNSSIIQFLQEAKSILLNKTQEVGNQVFQEEYLNSPATNTIHVSNGAQIQTSNPADMTTYNVQVEQGSKNPLYLETYKTYVTIDSNSRAFSMTSPSSSFTINISLKRVLSIRLSSIKIPPALYNFDNNFANVSFGVSNGTDISCIDIEPGVYDASGLITSLNTNLTDSGIDASFSYTLTTNKVNITSNTDLSFIFFSKDNICDPSACPQINQKINYNLGYFLGFRGPPNQSNASLLEFINNNLIIGISSGESVSAYSQLNLNSEINTILSVDDYNNNFLSEKIKFIEVPDNILSLPSYYHQDINCQQDSSGTPYVLASNPRTLSNAQLYTIQEILSQESNSYTFAPSGVPNTLAIFIINVGSSYITSFTSEEASAKIYTGPVNIDRLKLALYDSHGNLLDLHGVDWECVLEIEQQYQ